MVLTGLPAIFFWLFSAVLIASACGVIFARNPVHAVLLLILAFFNAAGLFLLQGAEFLAMILVIVYVGAVAVLFLFVVMMLDVDFAELRAGFVKYAPVGVVVGGVLLVELVFVLFSATVAPGLEKRIAAPVPTDSAVSNTQALGRVLYTQYVYFFEVAGLILLVAMIGAIVLTLRHKEGVKRQDIGRQVARGPASAMEIKKVPSGGTIIPDKAGAKRQE